MGARFLNMKSWKDIWVIEWVWVKDIWGSKMSLQFKSASYSGSKSVSIAFLFYPPQCPDGWVSVTPLLFGGWNPHVLFHKRLDHHGRPRVHTQMCGSDLWSGGPWGPTIQWINLFLSSADVHITVVLKLHVAVRVLIAGIVIMRQRWVTNEVPYSLIF